MTKGRSNGSVIIMTVWALFFLATLAVAVGAHVAANMRVAATIRGRVVGYCLAKAAVEQAVYDAGGDSNAWDAQIEPWSGGDGSYREVKLGDGTYSIYHTLPLPAGGVATNYGMADEESRININKAGQPVLKAMLIAIGELDSIAADDAAASILCWRQKDDVVLTGGAKNSYYAALSEPYHCHNAPFQVPEELMLP